MTKETRINALQVCMNIMSGVYKYNGTGPATRSVTDNGVPAAHDMFAACSQPAARLMMRS